MCPIPCAVASSNGAGSANASCIGATLPEPELRPDPHAAQLRELLVERHLGQQRLHAFGQRALRVRPGHHGGQATPEETDVAVQVTRIVIDPAFTVGEVDERLFGSFVEHMGRAVYGGIYEPGHADRRRATGSAATCSSSCASWASRVVRYPGGNFVSAYDWEDGVGPREQRPKRLDLAWHSIEPNTVGTDEFMRWAELAGDAADARGQPRHARRRRGAQPARVLQRAGRHAVRRLARRERPRRALRREAVVPRQRAGRAVAGGSEDRGRVRPARGRDRQGDALGRPVDRAVRRGQLELLDADVRALGGHGARPRLGRRRLRLAAHVLRPAQVRGRRRVPARARRTSTG